MTYTDEILGYYHGARLSDLANDRPHCSHGDHLPQWQRGRTRFRRVSDARDRMKAAALVAWVTAGQTDDWESH